jgi:hypothetical protein
VSAAAVAAVAALVVLLVVMVLLLVVADISQRTLTQMGPMACCPHGA